MIGSKALETRHICTGHSPRHHLHDVEGAVEVLERVLWTFLKIALEKVVVEELFAERLVSVAAGWRLDVYSSLQTAYCHHQRLPRARNEISMHLYD